MGFLAAFTLFGWDISSFLRSRKSPKNILSGISFLQAFKSLTTDTEFTQPIVSEGELMQVSQVVASRIGEKEILSLSSHIVPDTFVKEVVSVTTISHTTHEAATLGDIEDLLEVPKAVVEDFMGQ